MSSDYPREPTQKSSSPCCKVGRGIREYGLDGLNKQLIRQYVHDDKSLRDLEHVINRSYAEEAVANAPDPVKTHPEDIVHVLHDDEHEPGEKARITQTLKNAGVDVQRLESLFTTYRTVKTHLNECLDVDTSQTESITADSAEATIGWARTRYEQIVERTFKRLDNAELVDLDDPDDINASATTTLTTGNTQIIYVEHYLSQQSESSQDPDTTDGDHLTNSNLNKEATTESANQS